MRLIPLTCFFTGHRLMEDSERIAVLPQLEKSILGLIEEDVKVFICGGALGFDTLAAETVLRLKEKYDITLCLYLPCSDQTRGWKEADVVRYEEILAASDEVFYTSRESRSSYAMKKRNKAMVEASDICICYMKNPLSGTGQTVRMAEEKGLEIINLY